MSVASFLNVKPQVDHWQIVNFDSFRWDHRNVLEAPFSFLFLFLDKPRKTSHSN